jgi:hypothetical protein
MLYRALAVVVLTHTLAAQPSYFAARAPLTNTRYRATTASAVANAGMAVDQTLIATASTVHAALIVWNEAGSTHAGVRGLARSWHERLIAANEGAVAAASNGSEFLVVTQNEDGWSAALLDESGAVVQRSARIDFEARSVAASNTGFAVIGTNDDDDVVAARVERNGTVSATIRIREDGKSPVIASDGTGFIAVWQVADGINAARLGEGLQRIDESDLTVSESGSAEPAVAFGGTRYFVAWRYGAAIRARRIPVSGTPPFELMETSSGGAEPPRDIALSRLGPDLGLTWFDGSAQLVILDRFFVKSSKGFDTRAHSAGRLVALPANGVAFVQSDIVDDTPHHGATRLLMSVAHAARPPAAPDAPAIRIAQSGGQVRVEWPSLPQSVNGYRVEVRAGDGPWLEHDAWAGAADRTLTVDLLRVGTYQLRAKAWSDAGTSEYSEPVSVRVSSRRRAVR